MLMFDAIVIGGGPAGATATITIAKKGLKVALLEKGPVNRYKVCSGGIPLRTFKILELGIPRDIVERPVYEVNIYVPTKGKISGNIGKIIGYTVYRPKFDQWLRDKASDSGALVEHECFVKDIKLQKDYVEVKCLKKGKSETYRGKIIVGAFGVNGFLLRKLGVKPSKYSVSVQMELKGNAEDIDSRIGNTLNFYVDSRFSGSSYCWIFPRKEEVSVGLTEKMGVKRLDKKLKSFIEKHPLASKQLKGFKPRKINGKLILGHLNPDECVEKTYGHRFLLVGDAAGFADPITWEGIFYAVKSGKIAGELISEIHEVGDYTADKLSAYERIWKKEFGKYFEYEYFIRELLWFKDVDERWDFIAEYFNTHKKAGELLSKDLTIYMSVAPTIMKLSKIDKIRIGIGLKAYRMLFSRLRMILLVLFGRKPPEIESNI